MRQKRNLSFVVVLTLLFSILFPGMAFGVGSDDVEAQYHTVIKKDTTSLLQQIMRITSITENKKEALYMVKDRGDQVKLVVQNDSRNITSELMKVGAEEVEMITKDLYSFSISPSKIENLLSIKGIKKIALDKTYTLDPIEREETKGVKKIPKELEPNLETTHDDTKADIFREQYGYDGSGITVAILDTGVDPGHEMLQWTSNDEIKIIDWKDFTGEGDVLLSSVTVTESVYETVYNAVYVGDVEYYVPLGIDVGERVYIGTLDEYGALYRYAAYGRYPDLVEFNFNNDLHDKFPILAVKDENEEYKRIYVDTNLNRCFDDETALVPYSEGVENGVRSMAHFPRLDGSPEGTEVYFVLTEVEETKDRLFINLGFDGGEHGTHVAGIAAGNGTLTGIAPGANIMSLKVLGSHGGGGMSGIIKAMIYAAQNGADVVNMSLGSTADINDGSSLEAQYANVLTKIYGTIFCISAGNNGPGINTIGSPGDADKAITSGAYIESNTWDVDYGSTVPGEGLWRFSSIGPREDGAIKPTIVSPGSALSCVPTWDNYNTETAGYDVYQGTSMSSPHTAGLVALLTDAARKDGIADKIHIHLLQESLQQTARKIHDLQAVEQGGGLIDVVNAYGYIKSKAGGHKYDIQVNTAYNETLSYSTGIYVRNNKAPESVLVEVTNNEAANITLNLSKTENSDWYSLEKKSIHVPAKGSVQFKVFFNTEGLDQGLYSDVVKIDSPDTKWIDGELPITVVKGTKLTNEGERPYEFKKEDGEVATAKYDRNFIHVPRGVDRMVVRLQPRKNDQNQLGKLRSIAYYPTGMQAYDTYNSGKDNQGYVGLGTSDPNAYVEYAINNPQPGNWEINTYANFDTGNLQILEYGSASQTAAYEMTVRFEGIIANPDHFTAEVKTGKSVSQDFTFVNLTGQEKSIDVIGSKLIDLAHLPEPEEMLLEFGNNSPYQVAYIEKIVISPEDPNYLFRVAIESVTYPDQDDFDLYLFDENNNLIAYDADGDAYESISIQCLAPGTYYLMVENYAAAGDPTTIRYTKQIVNTSAGSSGVEVTFNKGENISLSANKSAALTATCAASRQVSNLGEYGGLIIVKDADFHDILTYLPVNMTVKKGSSGGSSGDSGSGSSSGSDDSSTTVKPVETSLKIQGNKAILSLVNDADGIGQVSLNTVNTLTTEGKSLVVNAQGIQLTFAPQSFLSTEFTNTLNDPNAVLELGAKALTEAQKQAMLQNGPLGENTGLFEIGGMIFDLTVRIISKDANGNTRTKEISSFVEPVAIAIDLSGLNLTEQEIAQLTGIRYVKEADGTVKAVKLGGGYDSETKMFTFYTDQFSYYSVVKSSKLMKIDLTIGKTTSKVNGISKANDVAPTIINNRTMVPVRFIAENLGADVEWHGDTRTVVIKLDGKTLNMVIDQPLQGSDVSPMIVEDRTMVPLRYVSEELGAKVLWFPSTKVVQIIR